VNLQAASAQFAFRPLGALSTRDTARAELGGAALWVDYGRPLKREREIFGNVVPWNTVWRTGANAATQLHTPVDFVAGGAAVPAGLFTVDAALDPGLAAHHQQAVARGAPPAPSGMSPWTWRMSC
jgi:hypothetical protein